MRPNPGPGTGPSSFLGRKHWQKPDNAIQYPALRTLAQEFCIPRDRSARKVFSFVQEKSKRLAGSRVYRLPLPVRGARVRALGLGYGVKGAARFVVIQDHSDSGLEIQLVHQQAGARRGRGSQSSLRGIVTEPPVPQEQQHRQTILRNRPALGSNRPTARLCCPPKLRNATYPTTLAASLGPHPRHRTDCPISYLALSTTDGSSPGQTVRFPTWRCPTGLEAALETRCSPEPSDRG